MVYPRILDTFQSYTQADEYIKINTDDAINKLSKYYPKCNSEQSLNGIIGGKNETYNVNIMKCKNHIDYYKKWRDGHYAKYLEDIQVPWDRTSKTLYDALKDTFLEEFIAVYLSRTYFKAHNK